MRPSLVILLGLLTVACEPGDDDGKDNPTDDTVDTEPGGVDDTEMPGETDAGETDAGETDVVDTDTDVVDTDTDIIDTDTDVFDTDTDVFDSDTDVFDTDTDVFDTDTDAADTDDTDTDVIDSDTDVFDSDTDVFDTDTDLDPIGFRFDDLDLVDPHLYADVPILGCLDVTNNVIPGVGGINPTIEDKLRLDDDGDGTLDLSFVATFLPLDTGDGAVSDADLTFPDCTAPLGTTSCELPVGAAHLFGLATSLGGGATCVDAVVGTTGGYTPAVVGAVAPVGGTCFEVPIGAFSLSLGGIPITLLDATVGGVWAGDPPTGIDDGLIRGFLSEADADATLIPATVPLIGGQPLSSLLKGGTGSCRQPAPAIGDLDSYTPPGGSAIDGWYLYLSFSADRVPYTEL